MPWLTRWFPLWLALVTPAWAQSPIRAQVGSKSKPVTSTPTRQVPSRGVSADAAAQLQALATAAAAAAAATHTSKLDAPASSAPAAGDASALVTPANTTAADVLPAATALESMSSLGPEPAEEPSLSPELWIARQIHQGHLPCELGASIRIEADVQQPGFFNVHGKGFRYRMFPVQTSTGALRLEDKKAGAVWLQLANKSMLMDQKRGRRLADECAHPDQLAYAQTMKTNPPPSLIDTKGLGR